MITIRKKTSKTLRQRLLSVFWILPITAVFGSIGLALAIMNATPSSSHSLAPSTASPDETFISFELTDSLLYRRLPSSNLFDVPENISLGPLLDYIDSPEFHASQEQWYAEERQRKLTEARATLTDAETSATETVRNAEKEAKEIVTDAGYAIANFRSHRQPGTPLYAQVDLEVVDLIETDISCAIAVKTVDNSMLLTNLAAGTCVSPGRYSQGAVLGLFGDKAIGTKVY